MLYFSLKNLHLTSFAGLITVKNVTLPFNFL